jgi:hypothetical protein
MCAQARAYPHKTHYHALNHLLKYLFLVRTDGLTYWRTAANNSLPDIPLLVNSHIMLMPSNMYDHVACLEYYLGSSDTTGCCVDPILWQCLMRCNSHSLETNNMHMPHDVQMQRPASTHLLLSLKFHHAQMLFGITTLPSAPVWAVLYYSLVQSFFLSFWIDIKVWGLYSK